MRTTDWYPGSLNPITVGLYEVEMQHRPEFGRLDLGVTVAFVRWEKRAGTYGFWMQEVQMGSDGARHNVSTLVEAKRWRGLVRPILSVAGRLALADILGTPSPKVRAIVRKSSLPSIPAQDAPPPRRKVLENRALI